MIFFNRFFIIIAATLAAAVAMPGARAATWQAPSAPWRVEAVPEFSGRHDLFVPVPAELGNAVPSAFQENGQPLPVSPVTIAGRLAGVEVEIPEGMARHPCFVYLVPAATASAATDHPRLPVIRQSWSAGMTTRPISLAEICRLMAVLPTVEGANLEPLAGIPADLALGAAVVEVRWPDVHNVHNKHITRIVHLYTQIKLDKAEPLAFAVANNRVPFCLFLDGQPVLVWESESSGGQIRSQPVVAAAGLHRLDFHVMAQPKETCPLPLLVSSDATTLIQLLFKDSDFNKDGVFDAGKAKAAALKEYDANANGGFDAEELRTMMLNAQAKAQVVLPTAPLAAATLASPLLPVSFALQRRDGLEAVRVNFEKAKMLWGRDNQTPLLFLPAGIAVPAVLNCASAGIHVFPGMRIPAFSVVDKRPGGGTFSFPALQPEARPLAKWPEISLSTLPVAIAARQDINLTLNLNLSKSLREMQTLLALRQTFKDAAGKVLEESSLPLPSETSVPWTFSVKQPPEKATVVELQMVAGGQPLTESLRIHLIAPDAPLERLTAMGDRLLFDGEAALLRCRPITPGRQPRLSGKKLAWYDEVWFTCRAPGADLTPETVSPPAGIREIRLAIPPPTGTGEMAAELARHAGIAKLTNADIVVWSLQPPAGSVYEKQRPFLTECLFLAQACQAHGCGAIFISLPPLPGSDPEAERLATLWMKELGMRAGFTVVDLYSRSQLDRACEGPLANPFAGGPAGTILASPGNTARAWVIQKVFDLLNP